MSAVFLHTRRVSAADLDLANAAKAAAHTADVPAAVHSTPRLPRTAAKVPEHATPTGYSHGYAVGVFDGLEAAVEEHTSTAYKDGWYWGFTCGLIGTVSGMLVLGLLAGWLQ